LNKIALKNPGTLAYISALLFLENDVLRIDSGEPSLRRRVVAGEEVVESGFIVPFFLG
jgi:hypothetical protein